MIPKIIHYCWFGKNPKPELMLKCIESWKKFCPDYEIIEWNETNFDVDCIPYTKKAYQDKRYAHVTDYARLKIVYENGGIYLDTDVELIASLDRFLEDDTFFAMQNNDEVATGLGFGSIANAEILKELMSNYEKKASASDDKFLTETCVDTDKSVFEKYGHKNKNCIQRLNNIVIYPTEYFNPKDFETGKMNITNNTVSIHHYTRSWHDECEIIICDKYKELMNKYEYDEAKRRFGNWYKRNHLRLLLKRYGFIGLAKKVAVKIFG